jgi:nucleoside-diphosphate-sugar epimerase
MTSVLIIGGTRFIGLWATRRLVEMGCDVTVFHRGNTEPEAEPDVRHLHGDRNELLDQRERLKRLAPDVVVDMIPLTRAQAVDTLVACTGIAGRIVGISSQDVYLAYDILRGKEALPPVPTPMNEDAPLRSKRYPYRDMVEEDSHLYDYDKIPVEESYLGDPDLPGTILRLPAVYGPFDYQHRPYPYLKRMLDDRPAILIDAAAVSWVWSRAFVGNVADAIARAVIDNRARSRTYNVAEPPGRTELDWIKAIARQLDWDGEIIPLPTDRLPEHLRDDLNFGQSLVVDTGRIRRELDYAEQTTADEAMRATIEWELTAMPDGLPPHQLDYDAEDAAIPDLTLGL